MSFRKQITRELRDALEARGFSVWSINEEVLYHDALFVPFMDTAGRPVKAFNGAMDYTILTRRQGGRFMVLSGENNDRRVLLTDNPVEDASRIYAATIELYAAEWNED